MKFKWEPNLLRTKLISFTILSVTLACGLTGFFELLCWEKYDYLQIGKF
jgi:hypothetical protein